MTPLVLLLLAQSLNLNTQPIESRQAGARLSTQRQYVVDCRTGMTCATDGGVLYLSSSGGTGGGGNFVSDTVTFATGTYDATKTVTAAWVSASSVIVCNAYGEEASVEGLTIVVISKAAGSFVVRAEPRNGRHTGALPFTCTGL